MVVTGGGFYAHRALADRKATPAPSASVRVATAKVIRTDLSDYWSETGTVGYRKQRTLRGTAAGVVTWLPRAGSVVARGGTLFRVNDRPVTLFYGSTPMFRDLGPVGVVGRDVRVLANNLRALGYRIGEQPAAGRVVGAGAARVRVTRDDAVFTEALKAAVQRWQWDRRIQPADGVLKVGDVLVLPGRVRVGAAGAKLGDDATGDVLAVSDQTKVVSVEIDADRADDVRAGQKVRITLPDSTVTTGTVGSVSTDVIKDGDTPKVRVVVTADRPAALDGLTTADVEVRFTGTTVRHVLAVPVGALLALSGGGYGLQVAGGALTAVKVGLFAGGMVQVSGGGITEGASVVTTS
ncbi:HlyD family efflux transporter periplasmic adaptor subunit [Actinoplanes sp. KI2]|uniref:HlyD family efflux transporter periplasmic adaptor subunit n=1 Tax=Actinoplanes sp. KI2 TaxID=2983315 RepID=UPI0021D5A6A2|nr:HlyD family efflux transporter periplasmic adaptor subunit [Actinoplanes sp. KI2]MCU7724961.1 HlyD family efflux transporter periplasmic adaptor subunit [Actinoplanes sp. KI2]